MRRFLHRLGALFRSTQADRELAREIAAHLQLLEDKYVAQGMTREDARYAAKREFGGVEQAKEQQRDARSFRWLAGWPMDLKLGARMLVKSPGLTVVAVTALAVAIGAGAAFVEFSRDLLSPAFDMPGGDRLVGVQVWNLERRTAMPTSAEDVQLLRVNARAMEEVGGARPVAHDLTTADGLTDAVRGAEITASAFRVMPASPLLGRALRDADERPDAPLVAVIGHELWTKRFNRDPHAVGALVRLGPNTHTVVGVMPEGFGFPINQNLWVPLKSRGRVTQMVARLREGASLAAAEADAQVLVKGQAPALKLRPAVLPYLDSILTADRSVVGMFRAINVVFILLLAICGANVATLVFARTAMREGEIAVRTALGASRGRISAQLFAEALVLSLAGAAAGLFVARLVGTWGKSVLEQGLGPAPFWWDDGLGYQTILYAIALAVLAALIVGIIPALKATGCQLQGRLREGASGTSTMKFGGMWTSVIVVQAALTVVFLATVVSLGVSSFAKSTGADVTYARETLLTARVMLGDVDADAKETAYAAIADRLAKEPGVAEVTYASAVPGTIWEQAIYEFQSPELQAEADARKITDVLWSEGATVGERYFETVGIPLVAGRLFNAADMRAGSAVAIVDETFVRTVLGGRSALGITLRRRSQDPPQQPGPWLEIVGVVKDASLRQRTGPDDASLYVAASASRPRRLVVRTHGPAAAMTHRVYAAAQSVHPDVRLAELKSFPQVVEEADVPARMFLRAFIVISAIALLLATAGIYALISFTLACRTREIGIRVALGAAPRGIISGVFSRAFKQIGLGVLAGALPGVVVMQSVAGDVGSMNLPAAAASTLGVCAFVAGVALVSCLVPLKRAFRIDPIRALRAE